MLICTKKQKIDKIHDRQKAFINSLRTSSKEDVTCINLAYAEDLTLRQMIMQIKSKKNPGIPLFHTLDLDWHALEFVFQYTAIMAEEAEILIHNLLLYLEGNYSDVIISDFFSTECVDRCMNMEYDMEKDIVIDKDAMLEFNEEEEDKIISFSLTVEDTLIEQKRPEKNRN